MTPIPSHAMGCFFLNGRLIRRSWLLRLHLQIDPLYNTYKRMSSIGRRIARWMEQETERFEFLTMW